jgi:hypothetical protein
MGRDLILNQMELRYFSYREFSLPLFSEVPMPNLAKWLLQIDSRIFLEIDGHDHPVEQPWPCIPHLLWPHFPYDPGAVTMCLFDAKSWGFVF